MAVGQIGKFHHHLLRKTYLYHLFEYRGSVVEPPKYPDLLLNPNPILLIKGLFSADKLKVQIIESQQLLSEQTNKQTNK